MSVIKKLVSEFQSYDRWTVVVTLAVVLAAAGPFEGYAICAFVS